MLWSADWGVGRDDGTGRGGQERSVLAGDRRCTGDTEGGSEGASDRVGLTISRDEGRDRGRCGGGADIDAVAVGEDDTVESVFCCVRAGPGIDASSPIVLFFVL